jgi:hypothetical protein
MTCRLQEVRTRFTKPVPHSLRGCGLSAVNFRSPRIESANLLTSVLVLIPWYHVTVLYLCSQGVEHGCRCCAAVKGPLAFAGIAVHDGVASGAPPWWDRPTAPAMRQSYVHKRASGMADAHTNW